MSVDKILTFGTGKVGSVGSGKLFGFKPPLLLDIYGTNLYAAYSLRKLRNGYTGNCVRVRRSSDNAEQDFGFVDDVVDMASIITFCGVVNGYVTTWYDQSGLGKDVTQATAANQPQILASGTPYTTSGKYYLNFATSHLRRGSETGININNICSIALVSLDNAGSYGWGLNTGVRYYMPSIVSSSNWVAYNTANTFNSFLGVGNRGLFVGNGDTTNYIARLNGTQFGTIGVTSANISQIGIGTPNTSIYSTGKYFEFILYSASQTANLSALETNINNYYAIY